MKPAQKFLDSLYVKKLSEDPVRWEIVDHPFRFASKAAGMIVLVPLGFVTDFASVPRVPLAYWLTGGCADESAVVHDYLYQTHKVGFMVANLVFLEGMKAQHIVWWRRQIMFIAVCLAGHRAYASGPHRYRVLNLFKK